MANQASTAPAWFGQCHSCCFCLSVPGGFLVALLLYARCPLSEELTLCLSLSLEYGHQQTYSPTR